MSLNNAEFMSKIPARAQEKQVVSITTVRRLTESFDDFSALYLDAAHLGTCIAISGELVFSSETPTVPRTFSSASLSSCGGSWEPYDDIVVGWARGSSHDGALQ
ncbi:hypothetical protein MTO96_040450 [Rhipicephalus appendiculatus]